MMNALVGYTGFVGSNIYDRGEIDQAYNSKNIASAFGTQPDVLIYAGLRAEKYLANNAPDQDMAKILEAEENIRKIAPRKLVLISTIDVFKNPLGVDETSPVVTEGLHAYGLNRYRLEKWVRENYKDALIIRLPGLFGHNLKKNFIYDLIHKIPTMLSEDKMSELATKDSLLNQCYERQANGFYKLKEINTEERRELKNAFEKLGFTALNFTDSRNTYQFYDLTRLWDDIQTAIKAEIHLLHPATEPICAGELYQHLTGQEFCNEFLEIPVKYDYRTGYAEVFGGHDGYIYDKKTVLEQITTFVQEGWRNEE